MSVAAAVSKGGRLALATDSQTNFGQERVPPENLTDRKYIVIGDAYMASTGWTLYANILDDVLRGRRPPRLEDEHSIFLFFNDLWKILHDRYSFVKDQAGDDDDSPFGNLDSSFLIVSPSGIFSVSSDLSVMRVERYFAIGSGAEVALGVMHALWDGDEPGATIARRAAQAAIDHNIYCGPPINVVTVDPPKHRPSRKRRKKPA